MGLLAESVSAHCGGRSAARQLTLYLLCRSLDSGALMSTRRCVECAPKWALRALRREEEIVELNFTAEHSGGDTDP
jgi:hypothetical protein